MENIFKKGLILGGVLAAAAAVGLAMTKEGQVLTEDLQKDLKALAKHVKKDLHKMQDVTKDNFDALVSAAVETYGEKKALAADAKHALVGALKAKWHEMETEYRTEQEDAKA